MVKLAELYEASNLRSFDRCISQIKSGFNSEIGNSCYHGVGVALQKPKSNYSGIRFYKLNGIYRHAAIIDSAGKVVHETNIHDNFNKYRGSLEKEDFTVPEILKKIH